MEIVIGIIIYMAEPEKNPQSDFMMEKIKERPVNIKNDRS